MVYRYADIGIEPAGTLAETALLLGQALGLAFNEDTRCRFDEYPAFVTERDGFRYALLGVPNPEDDVRDEPSSDFKLLVESIGARAQDGKENISQELVLRIQSHSHLRCWQLT